MLNVLHVTPGMSPEWGGPTVVVAELTSALSRFDVRCEILTARGYRVGAGPLPFSDVPVHSFDTGLPARWWTAWSRGISRFLNDRAGDFDLIHIHGVWHHPAYAAFRAARRHQLPCILTVHDELSEWGLRQKAIRKKLYRLVLMNRMLRKINALHAITPSEKEQLIRLGCETPIIVVPNGIDAARFDALPDPSRLVRRFPALQGKRVILFLGRLHPKKGLDILARSFSGIVRRFEDAALLIAGPDKFGTRESTEALLRDRGLLDKAVFTGLLTGEDKLAALGCADLFVLPSHSDVLGIAVLEAMAARLPVVITEGCGFPAVAEQGAGLIVRTESAPVAEAINTLLEDAALRERMGEQGRRLVAEHYTWQAAAAALSEVYGRLAAGAAGSRQP